MSENVIDERLFAELDSLQKNAMKRVIDPEAIPCQEISDSALLHPDPLVSVFMITYNHEEHIGTAIEKIVEQKCEFPFEVVIGEDGSSDRTRQLCLEYQKRFPGLIRLLFSDDNVGITANALRVLRRCRGRYVAVCEGDDYWSTPIKLADQVAYLQANPDVGLVHGDANQWDPVHGKLVERIQARDEQAMTACENPSRDLLDRKWIIITCTVMLRRKLLQDLIDEFPQVYCVDRPVCDVLWWVGCASRMKCGYIERVWGTKVLSVDSASRPGTAGARLNFCWTVCKAHLELNHLFASDDPVTKSSIIDRYSFSFLPLAYQLRNRTLVRLIHKSRKVHGFVNPWRYRILYLCFKGRLPYLAAQRLADALRRIRSVVKRAGNRSIGMGGMAR